MKKSIFVFMILTSFLVLASCNIGNCCGVSSDQTILSAAIVVDGPIDDGSFNKSSWEGMQKSQEELGYKVAYKQTTQPSDMTAAFDNFFEESYDIIVGIGYKTSDIVADQARLNLDQKYVIVDFTDFSLLPPNILPIGFRAEQSSFLVGYIAGKMTKTGKVGFVGGIAGKIVDTFEYGFQRGVYHANPKVSVLKQYADSFADVAKGKSITEMMYQNGADIVYQAAGATGFGVIEAAKEKRAQGSDVWAIGVDVDQSSLAPEAVLVSSLKNVGLALYNVLQDWKKGLWHGGTIIEYGLAEGAVGMTSNNPHVPKAILEEVEQLRADIIGGLIVIPTDARSWDEFKNLSSR